MQLFFPKERDASETRVALTPDVAKKLVKLGAEVSIETGLGLAAGWADGAYTAVGARVDDPAVLGSADVILRVRHPGPTDIATMKRGAVHVSYLNPFQHRDTVEAMAQAGVSAVSVEMIPRITRAQKMDVLSSQANLAGYQMVLLAATHSPKIFPLMMTAAGTLQAAKVLVVGAGVAGLQAIATARRLGARVSAYDTRPVVEEQVKSLGASFVKIDLGETGQTAGGYAKALTEEQLARQREALRKVCSESDVIITTAQVFGKKSPVLITADILSALKPGTVVVDGAVDGGGNVEETPSGRVETRGGVVLIGLGNLAGRVPIHASQMLAANYLAFIEEFWNKDSKSLVLRLDDEIIQGCLLTHGGAVVHPQFR
jgi:NAD(P) transhydrogenase subunit alpha